jgi:hypothetical protein
LGRKCGERLGLRSINERRTIFGEKDCRLSVENGAGRGRIVKQEKEEFPFSAGLRRIKWQDEKNISLNYEIKIYQEYICKTNCVFFSMKVVSVIVILTTSTLYKRD